MTIRVSTLEAFRRVCEDAYGKTEDELQEYIRNGQDDQGGWQADAGTEWHHLLAGGSPGSRFTFDPATVREAKDITGPGLKEVQVSRRVAGWPVMGHLDHWYGLTVTDHKLTFNPPDPEQYEPSLQWRFYLLLSDAKTFRYLIWHFSDKLVDAEGGMCHLKENYGFQFHAYEGLEQDCNRWVQRFIDWADRHRLTPYLDRYPVRKSPG